MKPRPKWSVLPGNAVLSLVVIPLAFAFGLVLIFRGVTLAIPRPFTIPAAWVAWLLYSYAFARWVLRVKTRPLMPWRVRRWLQRKLPPA